jgi:AraC family transcriptional regulator, regulatory protein of adaptative response / methylated-DNA-[protein]-cysteine methyltransferase
LDIKMSERIRYARGSSSLGDFTAAVSDKGLVAFEFGEPDAAMLDALQARFPDAVIEDDRSGLSGTIGKLEHLVDHPDEDLGIALDMRGSDYQKTVWTQLREIPAGETTNYGAWRPNSARATPATLPRRSAPTRSRSSSRAIA